MRAATLPAPKGFFSFDFASIGVTGAVESAAPAAYGVTGTVCAFGSAGVGMPKAAPCAVLPVGAGCCSVGCAGGAPAAEVNADGMS